MPGPWYRTIPAPTQIRVVSNVAGFDAAYAAAATGDRIVMNAGTYVMDRIIEKSIQIFASGHAIWHGKIRLQADNIVYYGMDNTYPDEVGDVLLDGTLDAFTVQANNISVINTWVHNFNRDGRNCILNPGGNGGTLIYGCVFHDSRHILYFQNRIEEAPIWIVHSHVADADRSVNTNANALQFNSTGSALNVRNMFVYENILARDRNIITGSGDSVPFHTLKFYRNFIYRTNIASNARPIEIEIVDNRFYETSFEEHGGGEGRHLDLQFLHGAGETVNPYAHPTLITGNLFYKPLDGGEKNMIIRTSRYVATGREEGVAPLRAASTGELVDNNTYYGFFRADLHANNTNDLNMVTLANWRANSLAKGNQWDTNSTVIAGSPPDYYQIWQNEYDADRAMIAVWNSDGAGTVAVTLPRAGDIYEIHDQWGTPAYTGSASYNITPYSTEKGWFGIIKYTGGAVPQTLVPIAGWNNAGSYTDQAGGTTLLHQPIDETGAANNTDYIKSPLNPNNAAIAFPLTVGLDPVTDANHNISFTHSKDAAGGAQINQLWELRQSYVNEGSPGTLIATVTYNNVSDSWVTQSYTLTSGEANSITNYAALWARFVSDQV